MAEAGRSWYTELDFDSYVLDLLLIGWCTVCFVIIGSVNAIVSAFGPLQKQPRERVRGDKETVSAALPVETTKWFNDAVSWFYLHYYYAPLYMDEWLKALNEQLTKLGGPVQGRFDRIQSGSLPPKITHISCEASPQDRLIIHAKLETRDLSFVVFASQQTHEGVKLTNVTASVLRLKGTLRVQSYREGADVKVCFNFEGEPEIKVQVQPLNPYQEASELVDLGVVEANVRNSIILAKTTITVTHLLMPGNLNTVNHDFGDKGGGQGHGKDSSNPPGSNLQPRDAQNLPKQAGSSPRAPPSQSSQSGQPKQQSLQEQEFPVGEEVLKALAAPLPTNKAASIYSVSVQNEPVKSISVQPVNHHQQQQLLQNQLHDQIQQVPRRDQQKGKPQSRPEGMFEPLEAQHLQGYLFSAPKKSPQMVGDKRLLVKVIKASGLNVKEVGAANTVVMLSTDEPVQGYSTSVVKNTQNPFWDEHFLFDITHDTQEVRLEVYDKDKIEDEFIGEAIVYVEDLRKTPSSRQILRLHPEAGNMTYNSGTVTAEFLFMDPSEADLFHDSMKTAAGNQLSPRRQIELSRSVTPASSDVTGSPSADRRLQYGYLDSGLDGLQMQTSNIERSTEDLHDPYPLNQLYNNQQQPIAMKDKKKGGFGNAILKRFGRKKRAHSAERTLSGSREGDYLRPPEISYGPQSKDDLELVRHQKESHASPNLKKSRTLGGSLKKLFRRSRKQSKSRGNSRESSLSRGSRSKDHSRDNSLTRQSQREYEQRASSAS